MARGRGGLSRIPQSYFAYFANVPLISLEFSIELEKISILETLDTVVEERKHIPKTGHSQFSIAKGLLRLVRGVIDISVAVKFRNLQVDIPQISILGFYDK